MPETVAPARPPSPDSPISPRPLRRVQIMSLEGLPGCGKSTQMRQLKEHLKDNPRVAFVDEPVEDWERFGFLKAMYEGDLNKATFQLMALTSIMAPLQQALCSEAELIITERSPWSQYLVFARGNLAGLELDAYAYAFSLVQNTLEKLVAISARFVYLQCDVDRAMERLQTRAREAEAGVPVSYMDMLNTKHEAMMKLAQKNAIAGQCHHACSPVKAHARLWSDAIVVDGTLDRFTVQGVLVDLATKMLAGMQPPGKLVTPLVPMLDGMADPGPVKPLGYRNLHAFGDEERDDPHYLGATA